jgi:outer membrane protein OmpA-like peptidoglycan-associated protein
MRRASRNSCLFALFALLVPAAAARADALPRLTFCPGFQIVTAINDSGTDYESIKTVESVDADGIRLRYSAEKMTFDWLEPGPPELKKYASNRTMRKADLESAALYLQHFDEVLPDAVPDTTAIGISRALFSELKNKGSAEFGIFIPFNVDRPGIVRDKHPNVYDNQMVATVTRTKDAPALTVALNDAPVALKTMRFEGEFYGDKAEFLVLDDPDMPLMLKFRIGIDAISPLTPAEVEQRQLLGMPTTVNPDKEVLRVVKIIAPCAGAPAPSREPTDASAAVETTGAALEKAIEAEGRADIESIFFTVNSATLRPESDTALGAIATLMRRRSDWRFSIEGHTDSQADEAYNLDLSKRRSAAVKEALVKRFEILAERLATTGYGESKPIADNATLEGRALNRRVELVRLP